MRDGACINAGNPGAAPPYTLYPKPETRNTGNPGAVPPYPLQCSFSHPRAAPPRSLPTLSGVGLRV